MSQIKSAKLFKGLSDHEIFSACSKSSRRILERGSVASHAGEDASSFLILADGALNVSMFSAEGKELVIDTITPGDSYGEYSLIDREAHPATCYAKRLSTVYFFREAEMRSLRENQVFEQNLHALTRERLKRMTQLLFSIALCDLECRIAAYFDQVSENGFSPVPIDIVDTQQEIGSRVNASRTHVNLVLKKWRDEGLIEIKNKKLTIKRIKKMKSISRRGAIS